MQCFLVFAAMLLLLSAARAKVYEKCEFAEELLGGHDFPKEQIADWVCLVQHESLLNTSAVGRMNGDHSADHGLFQINDRYWCSPPGPHNECSIKCTDLEDDDISDDIKCVRIIYARHGFRAWTAWSVHCKGKDLSSYIAGCDLSKRKDTSTTTTTVAATTTSTTRKPTTVPHTCNFLRKEKKKPANLTPSTTANRKGSQ